MATKHVPTALCTCKNTTHVQGYRFDIQSPVIELFKYSNIECLFSTGRRGSTPVSLLLYTEIVRFFRMTQGLRLCFLFLTKTISRTKFNVSGKLPNRFVAGDGPYYKSLFNCWSSPRAGQHFHLSSLITPCVSSALNRISYGHYVSFTNVLRSSRCRKANFLLVVGCLTTFTQNGIN